MEAIFKNSLGQEIEFSSISCTAPLILQKVDISTPVNIYTAKGMLQDGETYINNTLSMTTVDLRVAVRAGSEEELKLYREEIRSAFNPNLGPGYLYYKGRRLRAIVEEIPYFERNIVGHYQECIINLLGVNAYWEDSEDITVSVSQWKPNLIFPLVIPEKKKLVFGKKKSQTDVNVFNAGDKRTGIIVHMSANGAVEEPYIYNERTGQRFQLNKTLVSGEEFIINSREGEKRIDIKNSQDGNKNGYRFIKEGSEFIELEIGDNLIKYGAKKGADALDITVTYNNKHMGV